MKYQLREDLQEIDDELREAAQSLDRWMSVGMFALGVLTGFAAAWVYAVEVLT